MKAGPVLLTMIVALETVLVVTAGLAVVAFLLWFFTAAGTAPFPIVPDA